MRPAADSDAAEQLARLSGRVEELADSLAQAQRDLRLIAGQVAAVEWAVKLQPAGIPVADGRVLTKTVYGSLLWVDAEDRLIAPRLLLDRVLEPEVSLLLQQTVQPGDAVVDVGANIGYYTCLLGRKVGPAGHVYAFEADSKSFGILRDNVLLNDTLAWTTSRNVAVWSEGGTLKLFRRRRYPGNTSIVKLSAETLQGFGDSDEEIEVECGSLDSLLGQHPGPISLVKIDVEGSEAAVLRGMRSVVERSPDIRVVLEWALWGLQGAGGSPDEMWDLIQSMGLEARRIGGSPEPVTLQELRQVEFCYLLLRRR